LEKQFKRSLSSKVADTLSDLTYNVFCTLLVRAKDIINQRPIAIDNDLQVATRM
jgi:hypothetical protein